MAVSAPERRLLLGELFRLASRDLNAVWSQASDLSNGEFPVYVTAAYPEVADPYVAAASMLAANWFEESDPSSDYVPKISPLPPAEKFTKNAEWALRSVGDQGLSNLEGSLNRAVFDGARDTTRLNVEATQSRWAVDARPGACPWCRMMAIRGAVYLSKAGALKSCHDNGHCVALEDRVGTYQPPAHFEKWEQEYFKARANAGSGDPKAIQAAWRQEIAAT